MNLDRLVLRKQCVDTNVCLSLITSHSSSALGRKLKLIKRRETDKAP